MQHKKEEVIMKTAEELNVLKNEVEAINAKLADLTEEEIEQVIGGIAKGRTYWKQSAIKQPATKPAQKDENP